MSEQGKETKRLGEIVSSELKITSLDNKFVPIHKQILEARLEEKRELTMAELKKIHFKVVTMYGVVLPDKETDLLCFELWHKKYKYFMNQQELALAFQLNMTGDLGEKKIALTNFQFYTADFFTNVLNAYLQKKKDTSKAQQNELDRIEREQNKAQALNPYDPTVDIMQRIIDDFQEYHTSGFQWGVNDYEFQSNQDFAMATKLELVDRMFVLNTKIEHFIELRAKALQWLLTRLGKLRAEMRKSSGTGADGTSRNFGAVTSVSNQIARLRAGNLLTDSDEKELQLEVKRLMYQEVLFLNKPVIEKGETLDLCEFVNHIKENIELHNNKSL